MEVMEEEGDMLRHHSIFPPLVPTVFTSPPSSRGPLWFSHRCSVPYSPSGFPKDVQSTHILPVISHSPLILMQSSHSPVTFHPQTVSQLTHPFTGHSRLFTVHSGFTLLMQTTQRTSSISHSLPLLSLSLPFKENIGDQVKRSSGRGIKVKFHPIVVLSTPY